MSFGFGFGVPSWQALSGGFTPASLFSAGEQGAWYDPSDFSTLFTDSAGTTPVTAVEQFVGLMLDKSKGAPTTLGAELWSGFGTINSPWTNAGGGVFTIDGSQVVSRDLSQTPQYTIGKFYVTQFTLSGVTGGTVQVFAGEGTVGPSLGNGTYTYRQSASQAYLIFRAPAGVAATVSKVSVRELPGNHATQTTSTKRPKLAARYNLLTRTEEFSNVVWTKPAGSVSASENAIGPDGVPNSAATLTALAGTNNHWTYQSFSASTISYVNSVYAKAGTANWLGLGFGAGADTDGVYFNLSNGTVGTQAFGSTGSIQNAGNGWYRCTVTRNAPGGTYFSALEVHTANNQALSWTAAGTETILVWGADLRPTSQATGLIGPTYQRVAAATDYDTVGFLPYLAFDGIDDSMSTGSIDFTATDKMTVWAGVRKLSDAALAMVGELSANAGTNNGSFFLAAPRTGTADYGWRSTGTILSDATAAASYAAPITNVLAAIGNISGDIAALRVNGTQVATSSTDQGFGNYGNYPLFIGQRNNTSLPFNGWLSSLIIRGAQSTDSQISATESWVNGRTGAY